MKILICDDEIQYVEMLQSNIQAYMQCHSLNCHITVATSPEQVVKSNMCYDLAFLDIQMEGMDGITLAKKLKEQNGKIALFFVTNYDEYQDDAMDLRAFRFFSKPFDINRLYSGLDKAMEYIDGAYVDIFLYSNNIQQRILVDDILYITRLNRQVVLITKSEKLIVRENYDILCDKMPSLFFYPVHKSFYINLHYIKRYAYSEVYLTNDTRIPVASRKQAQFHKYWFEYLRRR